MGREDLVGLVGPDLLVAVGPDLPWVDGVVYLGAEAAAPRLWMDCRLEPDIPAGILASAVAARVPGRVAWLLEPARLVPLAGAERFDPAALGRWIVS